MEAIKLCRLDTPFIFIEARINLSRFVVTGCAAKTSATVTFPSLNLISLFAFCFNISFPSFVSGAMATAGKGLLEGTLQAGTSAVSDKLLDLVGLGGKSAADKGKDTRDYLAAAFPELNAWERAGADASSAGMVDAGFENQKELTKMQLD